MSRISGFTCSSLSHPGIPPLVKKEVKQTSMLKNFTDGRKFSELVLRCSRRDPPSSSKDSSPTDAEVNNEHSSPKRPSGGNKYLKEWIKQNVSPGDRIGLVLVCGEGWKEKTVFTFAHPNSKTLVYKGIKIQRREPLRLFLLNEAVTFVVDPLTSQRLELLGLEVTNCLVSYEKKYWGVSEVEVQGFDSLLNFMAEKAYWLCSQGSEKGWGGEAGDEEDE